MKVVMISNYWINSQGGGIMNYLTNLVLHINTKGIEVCVIFKEGNDRENYKVEGSRLLFIIKSLLILGQIKPDAIHTHENWYCLAIGYIYKKFHPVKLIHTFHTEPSHEISSFGKFVFRTLIKDCDSVTFVSHDLIQKIYIFKGIKCGNPVVTYAGTEKQSAYSISQTKIEEFYKLYDIKRDSIILLALGLTANKLKAEGAKLLIRAIGKLRIDYPNIILVLTRNSKYTEELKVFANKEDVSKNIVFTGNVENQLIPLKICKIYTHTPMGEGGVSLALLEAMAIGKPIIATSVGGIPEAINDGINGILTDTKEESIVQKIDYLLKNEDIAIKIGYNARITAEQNFNWGKTADKFINLYSQKTYIN